MPTVSFSDDFSTRTNLDDRYTISFPVTWAPGQLSNGSFLDPVNEILATTLTTATVYADYSGPTGPGGGFTVELGWFQGASFSEAPPCYCQGGLGFVDSSLAGGMTGLGGFALQASDGGFGYPAEGNPPDYDFPATGTFWLTINRDGSWQAGVNNPDTSLYYASPLVPANSDAIQRGRDGLYPYLAIGAGSGAYVSRFYYTLVTQAAPVMPPLIPLG